MNVSAQKGIVAMQLKYASISGWAVIRFMGFQKKAFEAYLVKL